MNLLSAYQSLIENIIDEKLSEQSSTKIARVVSYDAATNTCSVQPVTQFLRVSDPDNEGWIDLPQIDDLPVKQTGSGKLWQTVAPAIDSYGVLMVTDDDISNWLNNGGLTPTGSSTRNSMSNGYFDPGMLPLIMDGDNGQLEEVVILDRVSFRTRSNLTEVSVLDDESILLKNEKASVTIAADETITIANDNGNITISDDGAIDINGGVVDIASDGTVTINGNLEVAP